MSSKKEVVKNNPKSQSNKSTNDNALTITVTEEQIEFCRYMNTYKALELRDDLTPEQVKSYQNKIALHLWDVLEKFVIKTINDMTSSYKINKSDRSDILQSVFVEYYVKLPMYDPQKAAPSTFIVRYIREQVSKFLRDEKTHLTQYDSNNKRKIDKARTEFEKRNVEPTIEMLSAATGLSVKVIKQTDHYSQNAKMADVDKEFKLQAQLPTPEESFEEKENKKILYKAISDNCTDLEITVLLARVNLDEAKQKSFEKVAQDLNMPIRDVKAVYNSCVCKLNHDNSILDIFGNHNRYKDLKPLAMQDKASKTVETQMQDFLTQIKNSSEKYSLSNTTKYKKKKKSSPFFKGLDFLMEENYKKSIFATFSRKNFFGNSALFGNFYNYKCSFLSRISAVLPSDHHCVPIYPHVLLATYSRFLSLFPQFGHSQISFPESSDTILISPS